MRGQTEHCDRNFEERSYDEKTSYREDSKCSLILNSWQINGPHHKKSIGGNYIWNKDIGGNRRIEVLRRDSPTGLSGVCYNVQNPSCDMLA